MQTILLPSILLFLGNILVDANDIVVKNNNLIGRIEGTWGPDFTVKFQLNVKDFDNGGLRHPYSDVLHFTATDKTCCSEGDRVPSVHLHRNGRVIIAMWVNGRGNTYYTSCRLRTDTWYTFEIQQEDGVFTIRRDGRQEFRYVNRRPQSFENVRVLAADGTVTSNAVIRSLEYSGKSTTNCNCGLAKRRQFIVGGQDTEINEYPWMVQVLNRGRFNCGGSLINSQWVLSAAHCFSGDTSLYTMRLGEHDTRVSTETTHIDIKAAEIIRHPRYTSTSGTNFQIDYDYAMVKLETPVDFAKYPHIRPVCLPDASAGTFEGKTATVIGWGRLIAGGPVATTLQEVDVTVVSNNVCRRTWSFITDRVICSAGTPEGGKDACNGDSGGPMMTKNGDGITPGQNYYEIGVVSFGRPCAQPNYPTGYARVTDQIDWIQQNAKTSGTFCPAQ